MIIKNLINIFILPRILKITLLLKILKIFEYERINNNKINVILF